MDDVGATILALGFGLISLIFCAGAVEAIPTSQWGWLLAVIGATLLLFVCHSLLEFDKPSNLLTTTFRIVAFYVVGNAVILFGISEMVNLTFVHPVVYLGHEKQIQYRNDILSWNGM